MNQRPWSKIRGFWGKDLDLELAPSCMIESIEAKKKYEIAQKTGELTWD